ncbi:MAG TPA: hypothetical protein VFX16_31965 [Pseudonocardiaceae bacterium]|nr:hypothetical protein [Pseudonocardiaceae bacterium]
MDDVRALLALPAEDDTDAQRKVGDLLAQVIQDKKPIPNVETVHRLLRVSVTVLEYPQWSSG